MVRYIEKINVLQESLVSMKKMRDKYPLSQNWIKMIVTCILMVVATLIIVMLSVFIPQGVTANDILQQVAGTYAAVNAASTSPILGQLMLKDALHSHHMVVDGASIKVGDRILLKNELNSQNNGIYVFQTDSLERAPDMAQNLQITPGNTTYVLSGFTNGGAFFTLLLDTTHTDRAPDPVTGFGIVYTNTNNLAFGTSAQSGIATGYVPTVFKR